MWTGYCLWIIWAVQKTEPPQFPEPTESFVKSGNELINGNNEHWGSQQTVLIFIWPRTRFILSGLMAYCTSISACNACKPNKQGRPERCYRVKVPSRQRDLTSTTCQWRWLEWLRYTYLTVVVYMSEEFLLVFPDFYSSDSPILRGLYLSSHNVSVSRCWQYLIS